MRRIVVALMGTISGLVMLFSYHTSTGGTAIAGANGTTTDTTPSTSSGSTSGSTSSGTTSTPSPSATSSATTGSSSGKYTGDAVMTRWGTVQVQITVEDGKITTAEAVQFPQENGRDQEINAYAVPQLNQEAVAAQSASIDSVSGATVTSDGYLQSLQSAVDQANL